MKKILALVIAMMMVLAVAGSAMAVDLGTSTGLYSGITPANSSAVPPVPESITAITDGVNIYKEIKVTNSNTGAVYYPTVDYSYTITAATVGSGVTVTDSDGDVGIVYSGEIRALTSSATPTISFSAFDSGANLATSTAASTGDAVSNPFDASTTATLLYKKTTLTFDATIFPHPGIFRYKVSEADGMNTMANAGVTHQDNSYEADRYLDVYVYSTDGTKANQKIYGYVLWVEGSDENPQNANIPTVTKTNGFVGNNGGDKYNTFNLKLTKNITGSLSDTNHEFPFQVTFKSPNSTAASFKYVVNKDGTEQTAVVITDLSSSANKVIGALSSDSAIKLDDDDYVTFYGLPAGTTVTVQEMNDTYDVYSTSATCDTTNNNSLSLTASNVQSMANSGVLGDFNGTAVANNATRDDAGTENSEVTFTNEMKSISPTGVTLRFGPYALMAAAAVVLLVMASRRRKDTQDKSNSI